MDRKRRSNVKRVKTEVDTDKQLEAKKTRGENLEELPGQDPIETWLRDILVTSSNQDNLTGIDDQVRNLICLLQQPAILRLAQVLVTSRSEKNVITVAQDILDRAGQTEPIKINLQAIFGEIAPEDIRQMLMEKFASTIPTNSGPLDVKSSD